jgi:tetratricopeptide (TPR) repeat protein
VITRLAFVVSILCWVNNASAQSYSKAEMLYENGLLSEAQKELIDVVFSASPTASADKPKALNLLASIAVEKNNLKAALDAWQRLIRDFSKSPEAVNARARIPVLSTALGQVVEETVNDAAARVYLRSADFWSKERDRIFRIDASWISNVDAAAYWYDKVVVEFPGSVAARVAYEEKMRSLIGWKTPGQYGESHGVLADPRYFAQLEETFREYEKAFPNASASQAFRYQIAQAYWGKKDWAKTRKWLNEILQKDAGSMNSFYKDLAERRLKKVEY